MQEGNWNSSIRFHCVRDTRPATKPRIFPEASVSVTASSSSTMPLSRSAKNWDQHTLFRWEFSLSDLLNIRRYENFGVRFLTAFLFILFAASPLLSGDKKEVKWSDFN